MGKTCDETAILHEFEDGMLWKELWSDTIACELSLGIPMAGGSPEQTNMDDDAIFASDLLVNEDSSEETTLPGEFTAELTDTVQLLL